MRHRRTTTVVFLSLIFFTLATPAQDLKLMGELADRGAWKEAHALCRQMARVAASHGQHSATELRRLRLLDSALSQAASQRRQYGAAWEQLGRYDKALQYYDAKIASETDKVWPLAHNAGLIAARQGDWAKVSYFFRLLEKHGMDWSAKQGKARAEIADRYRQNPDDPDRLIELATKFWVTSIPFTGTDFPAALACLKSALDLTSDKKKRAEIYRHALDYAGRNNDAATIQTWRERAANETEPDNNLVAEFTIALGNESLRKNDLHEAKTHFSTVVQNMSETDPKPVQNMSKTVKKNTIRN